MKSEAFDTLTQSLIGVTTRRGFLRPLLALGAIPGIQAVIPFAAAAKKKHKKHKKNKKLKKNAFGCVDFGNACKGNDDNCCSGICDGKKPKKGKKDKSKCVAHNEGRCEPGFDACLGVEAECGTAGFCFQTTGKAGFCATGTGVCSDCARDTDCEALGAPPGSACVVCQIACPETGGTVCFPPGA